MVRKNASILALLVGLAVYGSASAQSSDDRSPGGRFYAPAGSTLNQWQTTLDSQWRQLNTNWETLKRYQEWFTRTKQDLKNQASALSIKQDARDRASQSWNTRVNPTCQSGETYASCSCRPGVVGKAAKRAEIDDLRRQVNARKARLAVGILDYQNKVNAFNALRKQTNDTWAIYQNNKLRYQELVRQAQNSGSSASGGLIFDENAPKRP